MPEYKQNTTVRAGVRKMRKVGESFYLSLPQEFVKEHNLKPGDALPVAYNGVLMVTPIPEARGQPEDVLIPDEELLLPYPDPENVDTDDENRLAVAAYTENYEQIRDYVERLRPSWEMVQLSMETVTKAGQKSFRVTKIIDKTPTGEENAAPPVRGK